MIKISKVEFEENCLVVRYVKPGEGNSEVALIREAVIAYAYAPEAIHHIAEQLSAIVLDAEDDIYDTDE
jgi:hypothetical protein